MTPSKIPDIDEEPVNSQQEKAEANETPEQDVATDAVDRSSETKKGKKKVAKKEAAKLAIKDLQDQLAAANEQVAHYREEALRAEAEMQNLRKRTTRDVENAHKYGTERLLQNLLPTVDSLEKAVEAVSETTEGNNGVLEGIEICLKMLLEVLARENVEQLDPHGEPFDPQFHEAMSVVEKAEMEPNSVVLVIQKGYCLNGRLVRPAMVIVSKAVAGATQEGATQEGATQEGAAEEGATEEGAAEERAARERAAQERAAQERDAPADDTPRIDEKA